MAKNLGYQERFVNWLDENYSKDRQENFRKILDSYGFPKTKDYSDIRTSDILENHPEPWNANQSALKTKTGKRSEK